MKYYKKFSCTNSHGFTLIEMLVALAIGAILMVASITSIRFLLVQNRLKAAANIFSQQIQLARSEAIQRQQDVYLNLQTTGNWCYGTNANTDCTCAPSNSCTLSLITNTSYPGVTITSTGFTGGSIRFDSIRGLPSEAASVSFQTNSKTITVNISSLGQISFCAANLSGYPAC